MLLFKSQNSTVRYLLVVSLVIGGLMVLKALLAWAAEAFLHPVPIIGGWLKSLEIIELLNVVVFALLGFGLGAATFYLPPRLPRWQKTLALAIAIPMVFLTSYWVRHRLWLHQISADSELNFQQAAQVANQALESASGSSGFWGYFRYTTQIPILPTAPEGLQQLTSDQKWFRSELTRFSGLEPGIFTLIFNSAGWGIRLFLLLLSSFSAVVYFLKGLVWADAARLRRLAGGEP